MIVEMQKLLSLENKNIPYTVRHSTRSRRLRLTVCCDGAVVLTLPKSYDESRIEKFLKEKSDWMQRKIEYFKALDGVRYKSGDRAEYLLHKETARKLVKERLEHFNKFYGFKFNRVSIKDQKTRWGSCSRKGNLNFNYRLALIPLNLADYIVVHELCHLKEFNHSQKFWDQVARALPNYKELRTELISKHILVS